MANSKKRFNRIS